MSTTREKQLVLESKHSLRVRQLKDELILAKREKRAARDWASEMADVLDYLLPALSPSEFAGGGITRSWKYGFALVRGWRDRRGRGD